MFLVLLNLKTSGRLSLNLPMAPIDWEITDEQIVTFFK